MEKSYKSEARQVKRIALSARLTFRQRKMILDYQHILLGILFAIMSYFITDNSGMEGRKILTFIVIMILSIPMYIILLLLLNEIPKFKTLEEQIEFSLNSYLNDHSWRNVYMLMKKHKFPIIIEDALTNILSKKLSKIHNSPDLWDIVTKDGLFKKDGTKLIKIREEETAI